VLADLPNFGGAAATYGAGNLIPVIVVNAQGIPTGFSTTTNTPAWALVTSKPTNLNYGGYGVLDGVVVLYRAFQQTVLSNSTTETTLISPSGNGTLTLAAGAIQQGTTIRFKIAGTQNQDVSATLRFKFKINGTAVLDTNVSTAPNPDGNSNLFTIDAAFTILTLGVSGTGIGYIDFMGRTVSNGSPQFINQFNTGNLTTPVTLNTTGNMTLDFTAQWSAIAGTDIITVNQLQIFVEA
jgi:hypothetical protein